MVSGNHGNLQDGSGNTDHCKSNPRQLSSVKSSFLIQISCYYCLNGLASHNIKKIQLGHMQFSTTLLVILHDFVCIKKRTNKFTTWTRGGGRSKTNQLISHTTFIPHFRYDTEADDVRKEIHHKFEPCDHYSKVLGRAEEEQRQQLDLRCKIAFPFGI